MIADPSSSLTMQVGDNRFGVQNWAHKQIGQHLQIPGAYYERLRTTEPQLLATNVNTLFAHQPSERRMIRTLDGNVRAVVSPKFFALDNYDLLESLIPTFNQVGAQYLDLQLTERHIYIVATLPSLRMDVPGSRRVGDIVEGGVIISNSEIGDGTLYARGFLNFLVCLNGMVRQDASFKRYHVGKSVEADADVRELLSNEAREADAKAIFLKLRDVTRALFGEAEFKAYVNKVAATTQQPIEIARAEKVVELTVKELALPEKAREGVLTELIRSGDFSRYGLVNAITAQSHEADTYETSVEFQKAGGKVIELSPKLWTRLAAGREAVGHEEAIAA